MGEHGCNEPPRDQGGEARLDREPGASVARIEAPFMAPQLHAEHRRLLQESLAGVEADECEIAAVDGEKAEEQDPAAKEWLPRLNSQVSDIADAARSRH